MIVGADIARLLAGPYLASCALLVIAGAAKVRRPDPTRAAVLAVGMRVPAIVVVGFGITEVLAGGAGAVFGGWLSLPVGAAYLVLTVFAARLLLRAPATPCACLGSSSSPVTRTHVVLDLAATTIALVVAIAGSGSPFAQVAGHWIGGAVLVALALCAVKLAALALELLPELSLATSDGSV